MRRIGIMGYGAVGQATEEMLPSCMVYTYDPPKGLTFNMPVESLDIIYICVDTLRKGPHDHEVLYNCLDILERDSFKGIVVVRCTVHPDFVRDTHARKLRIVHHPEFLKQTQGRTSDPVNLHVIGCDLPDTRAEYKQFLASTFRDYWRTRHNPCPPIIECSMMESIIGKLCQNGALAAKVILFNMIYMIASAQENCSFEKVRQIVTADPRIGAGHSLVPSPDDGKHGFAGHCLPKDVATLITLDEVGFFHMLDSLNMRLGRP